MPALDLTNYKLTFSDEFNARSISQTGAGTTWADIRPQWRFDANSDIGFGRSSFVDPASGYDPFNVHDGVLTITAVPDRTSSGYPGSWESGLITTQGHFSQTYGYFEIRADFSNLPGAWAAFWLLPDHMIPDPNNAGRWQELDIVENYGSFEKGIYSGIHTTDPAPNANWQRDLQVYSELSQPAGFHTYGMEWNANTISYYVDGQLVGSKPTPSDMHGPMYLIADLATQNDPNNNADAANVPISAHIDYIRVYSYSPSPPPDEPPPPPPGTPVTIGSGSDELLLSISQDAYNGDAQYTVWVDGVQIGGVQTAHASHAAGQSDRLLVKGNWASGTHDVAVIFLNDAWGGTPTTDRNLYVDGATYNGVQVNGAAQALLGQGAYHFSLSDSSTPPDNPPPPPPPPDDPPAPGDPDTTIGSGADQLLLSISQDAYNGDAQYTVWVDGVQIGGVQTAHALHAAGQSDLLLVKGNWGSGTHDVAVIFINDAWGGTPTTDRNLYVDGATYNGVDIDGAAQALMGQGAYHFNISALPGSTPPPDNPPPPPPPPDEPPAPGTPDATIGSGPDQLLLSISQDAYNGNAQYTVWVDGVQIGGVQTAHASHAAGQSDLLLVQGNWAHGVHDAAVIFLNDAWDGTPTTDRNLYVDGATYNGVAVDGAAHALMSVSAHHFNLLDV